MEKSLLLDVLHEIQEEKGHIGSDDLRQIASRFSLSMGQLFAEIFWYGAFRTDKPGEIILRICDGTVCRAKGNGPLLAEIQELLHISDGETTPDGRFTLHSVSCLGACENAPVMATGERIFGTRGADAIQVLEAAAGKRSPNMPDVTERMAVLDAGFEPLLLRRADSLASYRECDGFQGLEKALALPTRMAVIQEVETSGLRGRSGSAFPVGVKWKGAFNAPGRDVNHADKYIIVNGDEGDPGAFMDRWLMENTPYAVLEGILIAAWAIRATRGFFYIRHEYPRAVQVIRRAIEDLRWAGLLGQNILGHDFCFDCEVVCGAESYLCGEESALMESVEGFSGIPRLRPPFPVTWGLYGQPTIINNVETMANVPVALRLGGDEYAKIGTLSCTGTKLISLSGSVKRTGLVEIPMGALTLRELLEGCGGGMEEGKTLKCMQIGGPLGCFLSTDQLDTPLDFDSLRVVGGTMGSGGVIVLDETSCAVETARNLAAFLMAESCGACTPCREGIRCIHHILSCICRGEGSIENLDSLETLIETARLASRCAFGQGFAMPLAGSLKSFREEYEDHVRNHVCRAGKCDFRKFSAHKESAPC